MKSSVQLPDIRINGGTQSRAAINPQVVGDYAEALAAGAEFPPVVVFFDGSTYWLADGFHRYEAYARTNADTIPADVRQGTQRDAILYSVGANDKHGLRRSNDDKRRAVLTLLNDAEWSKWSDREIAKRCAVDGKTVAGLRPKLTAEIHSERTYTTKHGTTATMRTENIGKVAPPVSAVIEAPEAEPPAPEPEARAPAADAERRKLAKMTTDGLINEVIGLRADLADAKVASTKFKRERDDLAERLTEALAGDQGKIIGLLQKQVRAANYARDEAMTSAKRMEYRMNAALKRVAELEKLGIAV